MSATAGLVTLTDEQIQGLHCGHCAGPLVTRQFAGSRLVFDERGGQHLADVFVCAPDCGIAAHLRATAAVRSTP